MNQVVVEPSRDEVVISQLSDLVQEYGIPPLPPEKLQKRVVGVHSSHFVKSGFNTVSLFKNILSENKINISLFKNVLDFGCGCGRIVRAYKNMYPDSKMSGCDIDVEAIKWLQDNYQSVGKFDVNPFNPPSVYKSGQFNFIYGVSVFTHLPEDMQFQWLAEINRILSAGGVFLTTIHGEKHYKKFTGEKLSAMESKGFLYDKWDNTEGLPDFYQTTFHSEKYIINEWGKYFDVLRIYPVGLDNHQDIVLMRKKKKK